MADKQHLELLKNGVDAWNKWREENPDIQPDLSNRDLTKRDLRKVNLCKAKLDSTNLAESALDGAKLNSANLTNTNLAGKKLKNSDGVITKIEYDDATVAGTSFGMANLIGASLPAVLNNFVDTLKNVEETSKNARAIFFTLLAICAFALLATATTTDAQIVLNNFRLNLPIVNAEVSVLLFFICAPILILLVFVYLHMYLAHLWELIGNLPAYFPDGLPLRQKLYPWMLNLIVEEWRKDHKDKNSNEVFYKFRVFIAAFLGWWLAPLSIFFIHYRFFVRQDFDLSGLLLFVFFAAVFLALYFYLSAKESVMASKFHLLKNPTRLSKKDIFFFRLIRFATITTILFAGIWFNFNGLLGKLPGTSPKIELRGINLEGHVFGEVDLKDANLSFAKLNNADLRKVELDGIDLHGAELRSTDLDSVKMRFSDLRKTDLSSASLIGANLYKSNFQDAILKNTDLGGADLTRVNLYGADLTDAILDSADLAEADLKFTRGLTVLLLSTAKNLHLAHLDGELAAQMRLQYPHLMKSQSTLSK